MGRSYRNIGEHDSERLLLAVFSETQTSHSLIIRCIAHEVKSPEALQRANPAVQDRDREIRKWIASAENGTRLIKQLKLRAAIRTRDRFGVKSPIKRIFVFASAERTHEERCHRRLRAIIRCARDNRST